MRKVEITFYTNLIVAECQEWFTVTQETENHVTFDQIAANVGDQLNDFGFIKSDVEGHFYRTSIITDFRIQEVKENG